MVIGQLLTIPPKKSIISYLTQKNQQQGWLSWISGRLPPLLPEFDSDQECYVGRVVWESCLSLNFFFRFVWFLSFLKTDTFNCSSMWDLTYAIEKKHVQVFCPLIFVTGSS